MPAPFPVNLAELVGLFMESVLFGIFLVSFFACIQALLFSSRKLVTLSDRMILTVVLIMGFISVWDISLFFKNIVDAFINYTGTGGPAHVFANLGHWVTVVRGFNYGAQTLLGDAILIYRCWKVYFESWVVIVFPILIWFGILVCVISACVIESNLGQSSFTAKELSPFGTGFVSLTLSLNIIVTTMIAFRIWRTYSHSAKYISTGSTSGSSAMKRVMLTVIESGAVYSTALLILLGVFVSKNEANVPMSDSMVQIIPIVFNVIFLRIHQGRTSDQTTAHTASTIVWADRNHNGSTTQGPTSNQSLPFKAAGSDSVVDESFAMEMKNAKSTTSTFNPNVHIIHESAV